MNNSDQPAYPTLDPNSPYYGEGLTKREYFAGLAMQATDLEQYAEKYGNKWADEVAKDSVIMADALLKQLEPPDSWDH